MNRTVLVALLFSTCVAFQSCKKENPPATKNPVENQDSTAHVVDTNIAPPADSLQNPQLPTDSTSQSSPANYTEGAGVTVGGRLYKTVVLASGAEWMAENLRTTKYANGDNIPNVTDQAEWKALKDTKSGAWSYYDNDEQHDEALGKLYNWYAVMDERGLCPEGWHVSSYSDWRELIEEAGGIVDAWGNLKETGTENWKSPNYLAANTVGFSAVPGGQRTSSKFQYISERAFYWTSYTAITGPGYYTMSHSLVSQHNMGVQYSFAYYGMAVRCVKDAAP